jgi:uncharacterized membrane protein YheB (UPF0754 family)
MNNIDDILAKLRAGATEEDIAKEMSSALNTAVQKKKEEDAKLAAHAIEKRTEKLCDRIARDLCSVLTDFFIGLDEEDLAKKCDAASTIECVKETLEAIADLAKTNILTNYMNLLKSIDDLRADDKPVYKTYEPHDADSIDAIINDWLKKTGL